jgi:hypothetical protein
MSVRVRLPFHLRRLASTEREVHLDVEAPITLRAVLDTLERDYPMLKGTIRDHATHERRDFLRFFACQQDLSHQSTDDPLPEAVSIGDEPLWIVGAMAGG